MPHQACSPNRKADAFSRGRFAAPRLDANQVRLDWLSLVMRCDGRVIDFAAVSRDSAACQTAVTYQQFERPILEADPP